MGDTRQQACPAAGSLLPSREFKAAGYYFVSQPLWTCPDPSTKSLNSLALCLFPQKVGDLEATLVSGGRAHLLGTSSGKNHTGSELGLKKGLFN